MSPRLIMKLDVAALHRDGGDVLVATLRHPRRPELPAATAGAHVDIHLPDQRIRQYSLCGDPGDRGAYRVAIKHERDGRGGSRWLHEHLKASDTLMVSAPRNHFELALDAERYLLLAAGIGITPILTMAHALNRAGKPFHLHDFARSRAAAALLDELAAATRPGQASLHFGDDPAPRRTLRDLVGEPQPGTQIYCCGPARFMDGVRDATAGWPPDSVRFEAFQPLFDESFVPDAFSIVLRSSGATLAVPADQSALTILRGAGIALPSSCEIGVCGSCECGYLDGTILHRDVVLSPRARKDRFIPCVSRAVGPVRLDL